MHVDIIIPTFKRYSILQETLEGVRNQTYTDWRCWIAEDGESKETYQAIQPFLKDERFSYVPGQHSGSPAKPRNRAVVKGKGQLIAFLDDDDVWLPKKLEEQVNFLTKTPSCVLLGCNAYRWQGEKPWSSDLPLYFMKEKFLGSVSYDSFVQENYIVLSSSMIRRDVIRQAGLFNENLPKLAVMAEDYEFWLRVGSLGKIYNLEKPGLLYRETPLTYYKDLGREEKYESRKIILESVLQGDSKTPSPLRLPENHKKVQALMCEINFYRKGPRVLGRLRHEIFLKLKNI